MRLSFFARTRWRFQCGASSKYRADARAENHTHPPVTKRGANHPTDASTQRETAARFDSHKSHLASRINDSTTVRLRKRNAESAGCVGRPHARVFPVAHNFEIYPINVRSQRDKSGGYSKSNR
jgi:hypothetical protein